MDLKLSFTVSYAVKRTYQEEWLIRMDDMRESRKSVLSVHLDNAYSLRLIFALVIKFS